MPIDALRRVAQTLWAAFGLALGPFVSIAFSVLATLHSMRLRSAAFLGLIERVRALTKEAAGVPRRRRRVGADETHRRIDDETGKEGGRSGATVVTEESDERMTSASSDISSLDLERGHGGAHARPE